MREFNKKYVSLSRTTTTHLVTEDRAGNVPLEGYNGVLYGRVIEYSVVDCVREVETLRHGSKASSL